MSRRDNKNRVLRTGESQRPDGRYQYKYIDRLGKIHFVYSWKLEITDALPKGKRKCIALREKIKNIRRDAEDGLIPLGGGMTVIQLVEKYVAQRKGIRQNTRVGYQFVLNIIKKESFGNLRIDRVRTSDAKAWFKKLQEEDGRGYSTICSIRGVIKPAFKMAQEDDLLRKNPFDFVLQSVIKNTSKKRENLTEEQEKAFLEFLNTDNIGFKYYDAIYILLNTGIRISEFCGLLVSDIDFKNKKLNIERQLLRSHDMKYILEDTKTESGRREIPLTDEVLACFKRIIKNRNAPKVEPMIEGKSGFLFFDRNNKPSVALHWEGYVARLRKRFYNQLDDRVKDIPDITPHVFRHTYCTKMVREGMHPKTLQYLMGHSEIGVTLNTYTHYKFEDAEKELNSMIKKKVVN